MEKSTGNTAASWGKRGFFAMSGVVALGIAIVFSMSYFDEDLSVSSVSSTLPAAPGNGAASPMPPPVTGVSPSLGFERVRREAAGLIAADANWQHPPSLTVNKTERIGLQVGQTEELSATLHELMPQAVETWAGTVPIGPLVRAQLIANPDEADVLPSESVDASTPADVALLWTWMVRPKKPTRSLLLTVHIEVPLPDSTNVITRDKELRIPVDWTASYYAGQLTDNYGNLAAVLAGIGTAAGATWKGWKWWKKRPHESKSPTDTKPTTDVGVTTPDQSGNIPTNPEPNPGALAKPP